MRLFVSAAALFGLVGAASRRGWNSWDSSCAHDPSGNSNETRTLKVAAYMVQHLLPSGYNLLTIDEGWSWYGGQQSTNASLDGFGRPTPRPDQYPSAAGGAGFAPLAAQLAALGLDMGVWTIRGIPRAAAAARLPIAGSPYTCDQAVDVARPNPCSWDGYTYGCAVNASSGRCVDAALAYYASLAALYKGWGIRFVKVDCMWGGPFQGSYDADVIAFTEAFRDEGGIEISMSPGGGVSAQNITFLSDNRLAVQTRVTDDFWDDWSSLKAHITVAETFEPFFAAADTAPHPTYPDLDMLPIGDIMNNQRLAPSRFLPQEQSLLLTLWCFAGAPLIMGGDLPPSSNATLPLLTNARLLAVHGGARGRRVLRSVSGAEAHAWGAAPGDAPGDAYVALINAADAAQNLTLPLDSLPWLSQPQGKSVCAVELWEGAPAGAFATGSGALFYAEVGPHAAGAFRLTAC